jgi:hypothetical protein
MYRMDKNTATTGIVQMVCPWLIRLLAAVLVAKLGYEATEASSTASTLVNALASLVVAIIGIWQYRSAQRAAASKAQATEAIRVASAGVSVIAAIESVKGDAGVVDFNNKEHREALDRAMGPGGKALVDMVQGKEQEE